MIDSGPCSAYYNMAVDEAVVCSVREGKSPPTLRLYEWIRPSVTIGCFQKIDDVNVTHCLEQGIPVTRRLTGGRAILHDRELTYSFSAGTVHGYFSYGLRDSYKKISSALCAAFASIGFRPEANVTKGITREDRESKNPLCFHSASFGELTFNNRKIVGSAQKRWHDALLQQGSIPYTIDADLLRAVFYLDPSMHIRERMAGLCEVVTDFSPAELGEAIRVSFEQTFGIKLIHAPLSREEILLALDLESRRYSTREWLFQRQSRAHPEDKTAQRP